MKKGLGQQVNPKVAGLAILIVLAIIQIVWWKGLVSKPPMVSSRQSSGGGAPTDRGIAGREDIAVETLAGMPEPGTADGIGRNARFDAPCGIALDQAGNIVVADSRNHRIRLVAPDGNTTTLAGGDPGFRDGEAKQAQFTAPCGVAIGPNGAIFVADTGNNRIRRILNGQVTTLAGGEPGYADGLGPAAKFNGPLSITSTPGGGLVVADALNKRLRMVDLSGKVTSGPLLSQAPTGVVFGKGLGLVVPESSLIALASPAVGASDAISHPPAISLAHLDIGQSSGNGSFKQGELAIERPTCLSPAMDGKDSLYLADNTHAAVFEVHPAARTIEVLAGTVVVGKYMPGFRDGTGNRAGFGRIGGMVADGKGHLYIADTDANAIRRLTMNVAVPENHQGDVAPEVLRKTISPERRERWQAPQHRTN